MTLYCNMSFPTFSIYVTAYINSFCTFLSFLLLFSIIKYKIQTQKKMLLNILNGIQMCKEIDSSLRNSLNLGGYEETSRKIYLIFRYIRVCV